MGTSTVMPGQELYAIYHKKYPIATAWVHVLKHIEQLHLKHSVLQVLQDCLLTPIYSALQISASFCSKNTTLVVTNSNIRAS